MLQVEYLSLFKTYMLKLYPHCGSNRIWGLEEVTRSLQWSPHEQNQCPLRRGPRQSPCSFFKEKKGIYKSGRKFLPGTEIAGALILVFSASRTVRKKKISCLHITLQQYSNIVAQMIQDKADKNHHIYIQHCDHTHCFMITFSGIS